MIHFAIVEDDPEDTERLKECLEYVREQDGIEYTVTEFSDADHFLFRSSFDFDIVFLDIQMPGIDGMEAARKIRQENDRIGIVFITNMGQFAIRGYEVNALDFVVKPVEKNDFYLKMRRVLSRLQFDRADQLVIGASDQCRMVSAGAILYVEVSGHYVTYHLVGEDLLEYATLKEVEKKLQPFSYFVRCSRYALINLYHVDEISGNDVVVEGRLVPISRSMKQDFCRAFAGFVSVGRSSHC